MRPNAARASVLAVVLREGADNPLAAKAAFFIARDACQSSHDKRMIRDVVSSIFIFLSNPVNVKHAGSP
jgi:hypothetical protein